MRCDADYHPGNRSVGHRVVGYVSLLSGHVGLYSIPCLIIELYFILYNIRPMLQRLNETDSGMLTLVWWCNATNAMPDPILLSI